jgi:hypothetical protein
MPEHGLARDVVLVVVIKLIVVIAVSLWVFGPKQRPKIDAQTIETRLLGAPAPSVEPGDASP